MNAASPVPALISLLDTYLRTYHRHEMHADEMLPDTPCLVVANHGFGGALDLNTMVLAVVLDKLVESRPITFLVHQVAWTFKLGWLIEPLGCRPGSQESVDAGFAAGHHVAVFPGGDIEAAKPFAERNLIKFDGRTGFARVAIEHDVPIVPVVTAGAGESLFVLNDGQRLAKLLRLPQLMRAKSLAVSLSIPWGLNVGLVGMALPYVPLPTKLVTAVLPPMRAHEGESAEAFAGRVHDVMQAKMDELTAGRRPVIG
ncbi:MAG: 1-acyl-sn-glycerol-3-phosphate acyltransferase [Nocardiaceae bacterium]|nr:1-acyl-sn-glycerol-3-phosphate acyltransferase [Nocardiaceae bacterium]